MINGLDVAFRRIKLEIPEEILFAIFGRKRPLEESLKEMVIYQSVIPDCNLSGGKVLNIILKREWIRPLPMEPFSLFEIPEEAREGRNIIEVHSISRKIYQSVAYGNMENLFPEQTGFGRPTVMGQSGAMIYASERMLASKTGAGQSPRDPIPELMGNMVRLNPGPMAYVPWSLTCRVCYDNEMTNLNSAAIEKFAKVCELATKRYCFTTLSIKMESGEIEFGTQLSAFKDQINKWGDLGDAYDTAVKSFSKSTMMDIRRFTGIINSIM
jgi:hypothetical protein